MAKEGWWGSPVKRLIHLFIVLLTISPLHAGTIALIIDDIGYNYSRGLQAAQLDPAITLSILPDAPESQRLAAKLRRMGRELMLHIPMQADYTGSALEPVVLRADMERREFQRSLIEALARYPGISGVNNHMGSLLTREPQQMGWLMQVLRAYGHLYFVDSRTDKRTVAEQVARQHQLAVTRRDVFLDNGEISHATVWSQLKRLEKLARRSGFALAIGHPYPITLAVLKEGIPWLRSKGHTIVPVSEYIAAKESIPCPECSSPSLKLVKNSKRSPSSTCCGEPVLR